MGHDSQQTHKDRDTIQSCQPCCTKQQLPHKERKILLSHFLDDDVITYVSTSFYLIIRRKIGRDLIELVELRVKEF
jgi:hypothetical protein